MARTKLRTLEHPDIGGDPQFRFKIVATFSDPLTRQLAEAVRIEKRGPEILNSKSEFSRCRVPRLRLELDGWKKQTEKEKEINEKEAQERQEDLSKLEDEARRKERKRKEGGKEKKPKRRKLDRLVGWGEEEEEDSSRQ